MLTLNDGRKELYQWDTGRTATLDIECEVVHFSNLKYGESLVVEVKEGEVSIPNKLLMSSVPIYCWAVVKDDSGSYTKKEQTFAVIKKAKPSDYVYTETEVITIKTAVEKALEEAKESGDFKGDKGDKGDKGEQGIQGLKGDKGDKGDKGEPAVTDQSYNSESENAQSGIAVAEAINLFDQSKQKNYELIATMKVAPDENGNLPASIVFTQDSNGNLFEITDFYCKVYAGISGVASPRMQIIANKYMLISNLNTGLEDNLRYWYFRFTSFGEKNGGLFSAPNSSTNGVFPNANIANGVNLATGITSELDEISKIAINVLSDGGKWIENSEFQLYGVRK